MSLLFAIALYSHLSIAIEKQEDHSPLVDQLECINWLEKICENEKDQAACMVKDENLKKLPKNCQSTNNCHEEVKKNCPNKDDELAHLNCLRDKKNSFSTPCQKLLVPSEETLEYMNNCGKDIDKICPEDEKLMSNDPVAAAAKQDDCIKKNQLKFNPKCQQILKKEAANL